MTPTRDERADRDDVLRGVDLAALLEDLGADRGLSPRGKQFPCPNVAHEQTGKTPPATIDAAPAGYGVWRCHACGEGGSAVDALLAAGRAHDVADAFAQLRGDRGERSARNGAAAARRPARTREPAAAAISPAQLAAARAELARYVEQCHARLQGPEGEKARTWLRARGLTDDELAAHRIGYDPGYRQVQRARGQLPAPAGPAVVLPLLDEAGDVIYAQARPLEGEADGPKYLNPHRDWIGPSPRVGAIVSPESADRGVLVVCEGICDAILAGRHFAAWAMIGAGQPDAAVAERLVTAAAKRPLVVCFDADADGQAGAERLVALVAERSTDGAAAIAPPAKDVNALLLDAPAEFDDTMRALVATAVQRARPDRPRLLRGQLARLDQAFLDPTAGVAQPTGFATLDAVLAGGLRAGVYMLAAPPGAGKTAIASQAAWYIARRGHPVIYWATEQTDEQLVARHVCSMAQLNVSHYWRRTREWREAWKAARGGLPLDTIAIEHDEPRSEDDDRGSVGRLAATLAEARAAGWPVPVVIVDYLQDLQPEPKHRGRDEREQLSATARALLRLARRHAVPMLIVSSVARDKYSVERPTLAAFKGSGDIEYTLDCGLVLRFGGSAEEQERMTREEWSELPLELHPVKNRFGRAGGGEPIELQLHADTGTLLDGDGQPLDNHPPALPGVTQPPKEMPF